MSSWTSSRAISVGIDSRILVVAWLNLAHFEEKRARNSALPQAYLRHLGVGGRRYKQRHGHGGRAHGRHIRHFGRTIDEIHEVAVGMPEPACERSVSYTHLRAHETDSYLVCRLLLEKKKT